MSWACRQEALWQTGPRALAGDLSLELIGMSENSVSCLSFSLRRSLLYHETVPHSSGSLTHRSNASSRKTRHKLYISAPVVVDGAGGGADG